MKDKVKVQWIEGNGNPEYFQRYQFDAYLGKKMESYTAAYDTMPARLGQTLKEEMLTKMRNLDKILTDNND